MKKIISTINDDFDLDVEEVMPVIITDEDIKNAVVRASSRRIGNRLIFTRIK